MSKQSVGMTGESGWRMGSFVTRSSGRTALRIMCAGLFAVSLGSYSNMASAETIVSALKSAYRNHPGLLAERARQRGTDEVLPQAQSGWRPTITAQGDVSGQLDDSNGRLSSTTGQASFSITLNQPIFDGLKTLNGEKQARVVIKSGQQNLLNVEQQVLLDGATAYMDVLRDRRILHLRRRNVAVLAEQLRASRARFSVGEITRTDVAQSQARLALANAELSIARANLSASNASFVRIIGRNPGKLVYPRVSRRVPSSLDRALRIAAKTSPSILAAAYNEEAARLNVQINNGDLLPKISLQAQVLRRGSVTRVRKSSRSIGSWSEQAKISGVISVPLYQSGRVASKIREAKHEASRKSLQLMDTRRQVRQSVVSAWNALLSTRQNIKSINAQVRANRLALDGVRQEAKVGSRTTLDILDAERELVISQVSLAQSRRNEIVAAYQLIAAMGRMTAKNLGLSVAVYDPAEHVRNVDGKWFGTGVK